MCGVSGGGLRQQRAVNHRSQRVLLEERPQRTEAFLDPVRARRQAEIECDHRGTLLAEHGDGAESIPRHKEPKILGQGPFHRRASIRIVIDE